MQSGCSNALSLYMEHMPGVPKRVCRISNRCCPTNSRQREKPRAVRSLLGPQLCLDKLASRSLRINLDILCNQALGQLVQRLTAPGQRRGGATRPVVGGEQIRHAIFIEVSRRYVNRKGYLWILGQEIALDRRETSAAIT